MPQYHGCCGRCKLCVLPSLVMANQHLWSIHPANPFNASEPFGAGKRVPALDRIHKAWDLFTKACAPHTQPSSLFQGIVPRITLFQDLDVCNVRTSM